MDLELELKARREEQANAVRIRYNELLLVAAKGKPKSGELNELAGITEKLGIDPAATAATVAKLKRRAGHQETIALGDEITADATESERYRDEYDRETVAMVEQLKIDRYGKFLELSQTAVAAAEQKRLLEAAIKDTAEIDGELWQILDLPDPAIAARTRHLYATEYGRDCPQADFPVVALGQVIESPRSFDFTVNGGWKPLAGQSQDDLDEMLAMCRAWKAGMIRQPRFISRADAERSADMIRKTPNRLNPGELNDCCYVRRAGQTQQEIEECSSMLARAWNGHRWNARLAPIKPEHLVWPTAVDAPKDQETVDFDSKDAQLDARGPRVWDGSNEGNLVPVK